MYTDRRGRELIGWMCGPEATGQASRLRPGRSTAGGGPVRDASTDTIWSGRGIVGGCSGRPGRRGRVFRRERAQSGIPRQPLPKPAAGDATRPWRCGSGGRNACGSWRSRVPSWAPIHDAGAWWPVPTDPSGQPMSPHLAGPCPESLPNDSARRGLRPCVRPELRPPAPGTGSCTAHGRRRPGPAVPCGCPSR